MKPENKAKELVDKYKAISLFAKSKGYTTEDKQRAEIAVKEIITANPYYFYPGRKVMRVSEHSTKDYWQKVLEAINAL